MLGQGAPRLCRRRIQPARSAALHELAQRALSVGKASAPETAIDAAPVVVSVAGRAQIKPAGGTTAVVTWRRGDGRCRRQHLTRAGVAHSGAQPVAVPGAAAGPEAIREFGAGRGPAPDRLANRPGRCRRGGRIVLAVRPVVSLADVHHALAAAQRDEATRLRW